MTEFNSIQECMAAKEGNIRAKVIKAEYVVISPSNATKKWARQDFLLKDESGSVKFTTWNEERFRVHLNKTYELTNGKWGTFNGAVSVQLGGSGSLKLVEEPIDDEAQERLHTAKLDEPAYGDFTEKGLEKFALKQNKILSKISLVVCADLSTDTIPARGDVVWVRTKEIYNLWSSDVQK